MLVHVMPAVGVQRRTPPDALGVEAGLCRDPTRSHIEHRMSQPDSMKSGFVKCPLTQRNHRL